MTVVAFRPSQPDISPDRSVEMRVVMPRVLVRAWRLRRPLMVVVIPTLLAALYYGLAAAPIYVSESKFIVRSASPPSVNGVGSLLATAGLTRSQDDSFSVQDFIQSRDALGRLQTRLSLRDIYARPEADRLARFPRPWEGSSFEDFFRYFTRSVDVVHNSATGIVTLKTEAFRPQDSYDINQELIGLSRAFLARLNDREREDAVKFASTEVRDAEQRVLDALAAITEFRNKELLIDPPQSSIIGLELIGRLATELARTRARQTEVLAATPESAELAFLGSHVNAIEKQIIDERAKLVGNNASIAPRIAEYERLSLTREFAEKALASASSALDAARGDARRERLYLELVVEPDLPDAAELPDALKNVAIVFLVLSIGYFMSRLLLTAARDYMNG